MQIRWKRVLKVVVAVVPAVLAGTALSVEIRQQVHTAWEKKRLGVVAQRMKLVYIAAVQYAAEHKERLPDADHWEQELRPYMPEGSDFTLPSPSVAAPRRVAINPRCAGKKIGDGSTILFFESISRDANAHDDLRSLPKAEDGAERYCLQFTGGQAYDYPLAYCDTMRSDANWALRNQGSW